MARVFQDPGQRRRAQRDQARDEVLQENFLYGAEAEAGRGEMTGRMADPTLHSLSTSSSGSPRPAG